jgi:molybdate transport system substrate-binding protein
MAPRSIPDPSRRAILAAGLSILAAPARARSRLVVFAAASLKPALDEIAATWPEPVALSYGGSGSIARQAVAGAPADVIVLAAQDWMDWLAARGVVSGSPRSVAGNRLILAGPAGAVPLDLTAAALLARLGPDGRMAMGDPMSVPAGRYGREAMESLGLWPALEPRALLAENVRAALAFVARGDVALGLVYATDARGTGVDVLAQIPADAHTPIAYPAAILPGADAGAADFLDHVTASGAIFARHGFLPV